ncbi:MAG: hypothetical protein LBD43_02740 [Holosporales bacterium]|jgi:hypothetical protein|nr:hypothetical protein [Holosporales bacterium]
MPPLAIATLFVDCPLAVTAYVIVFPLVIKAADENEGHYAQSSVFADCSILDMQRPVDLRSAVFDDALLLPLEIP